ncbi:MAG: TonB-dependent receptor [Nitrospira sp.]|nr:MAG: TonB-dependent receptor [Nitrospira sp.]
MTHGQHILSIVDLAPVAIVMSTVSEAYRPPTLFERECIGEFITTLPPPIPSPAPSSLVESHMLKPEQIVSYDVDDQGWWFKHRLRVRGDFFFNHISDLINFVTIGTTPFSNRGVSDIYGMEIGAEFRVTQWLSGFMNASYQQIGQTFEGVGHRGGPVLKVNAGLRGVVGQRPEWRGNCLLRHGGYVPSDRHLSPSSPVRCYRAEFAC